MNCAWPCLVLALIGQDPAPDSPQVADGGHTPEQRLTFMRESMKTYEFSRSGDTPVTLKLQAEPAFRLGRQGNNLLDGAVFLFTDDVGRPGAAMQPFLERTNEHRQGKWLHEFTSLSTGPIVAKRAGTARWSPAGPGLELHAVPAAPKPAASAPSRLRQMRKIADEFHADDDFGGGGWLVLRMLTTPIARYGKAGAEVEDGALFAFVEGTDSEVFLFVEARKGADGLAWHYGLAPMGCWAVKVKLRDREVWSLPRRSTGDPTKPLFSYQFWP